MGNSVVCDASKTPNESLINLSEPCVKWITTEKQQPQQQEQQRPKKLEKPTISQMELSEETWRKRLIKLDHQHSIENNLTTDGINKMFNKVEEDIGGKEKMDCHSRMIIDCLKENENTGISIIKCKQILDEFIECTDMARSEKLKQILNDKEHFIKREIHINE